jgi:GMP synthase-like glutamine amidotransferase
LVPGKNFDSIASSSFSDSEVIVHKNKKIAGVSFHPEVCNRSFFYSFFEWAGH